MMTTSRYIKDQRHIQTRQCYRTYIALLTGQCHRIYDDQPAQKWLKDLKGRTLSMDDIFYYQKIIVSLTETYRLMKEVDQIKINFNY